METKLTTFKLPAELHKKIKEIAAREGRDMTDILTEKLEEYVKIHGEGNPVYALDKWQDPAFKICPAFFEDLQKKWLPYIDLCTKSELIDIIDRGDALARNARKKLY